MQMPESLPVVFNEPSDSSKCDFVRNPKSVDEVHEGVVDIGVTVLRTDDH